MCLSIFSDFASIHTEWANEKGTGWSPSYTVGTVLLNLISFLLETSENSDYYKSTIRSNVTVSKNFKCPDCGHCQTKPWPELPADDVKQSKEEVKEGQPPKAPEVLTCYVTRTLFGEKVEDKLPIFGFGICQSGPQHNIQYTSPCEFMTLDGYNTLAATGKIESVMRETINYFLPLYISPEHGSKIKPRFEQSIAKIAGVDNFSPKLVLQVLPKLLNSTVVTFMNGTQHTR